MRLSVVFLTCVALLAASASAGVSTFYVNDFESGIGDVIKIDRYDDTPTPVSTDAEYPAAFPPPSGSFAMRCADDDNTFFGLNSGHSVYYIDRSAIVSQAILEADIYVVPSAAATEDFNALVALEDVDSPLYAGTPERYYRFGYRFDGAASPELVLQEFNAASFTVLGTEDASSLSVPDWHTFRLEFDNLGNIDAFVDGNPMSYNPINNSLLTSFTVGVLGFDLPNQSPILADNFLMADDAGTVPVELSVFSSD